MPVIVRLLSRNNGISKHFSCHLFFISCNNRGDVFQIAVSLAFISYNVICDRVCYVFR